MQVQITATLLIFGFPYCHNAPQSSDDVIPGIAAHREALAAHKEAERILKLAAENLDDKNSDPERISTQIKGATNKLREALQKMKESVDSVKRSKSSGGGKNNKREKSKKVKDVKSSLSTGLSKSLNKLLSAIKSSKSGVSSKKKSSKGKSSSLEDGSSSFLDELLEEMRSKPSDETGLESLDKLGKELKQQESFLDQLLKESKTSEAEVDTTFLESLGLEDSGRSFLDSLGRVEVGTSFLEKLERENARLSFLDSLGRQDSGSSFLHSLDLDQSGRSFLDSLNHPRQRSGKGNVNLLRSSVSGDSELASILRHLGLDDGVSHLGEDEPIIIHNTNIIIKRYSRASREAAPLKDHDLDLLDVQHQELSIP